MNGFIKFPASLYPLLITLSLAQNRVLNVIVRQTIGWHKTQDAISLSQFQHGIGKEPGTGMTRSLIVAAIRFLELQGIIRVTRRMNAAGVSLTSIYSLAERFLDGVPTASLS